MAAIDDLIAQIEDKALRARLKGEADRLRREKKFGLVFEEHLPELTPIYSTEVRPGCLAAKRGAALTDIWRVLAVEDGQARCLNRASGVHEVLPVADLVVVLEFGDPIFPSLVPMDRVQNGPDGAPWHTLIEADNYHALQLLEYLYAGQVDCIYIDPPYNTGARDWKYNNDFVDSNDRWRHSKWLAMMRRRLCIAANLLKDTGILCITIDDYEHHHLRSLIESSLPGIFFLGAVVVRTSPSGRPTTRGFRVNHEYALFFGKSERAEVGRLPMSTGQQGFFNDVDDEGPFGWQNLRKRGGANTFRKARPKQYFPLFANAHQFRVPAMAWNKELRQWELKEEPREDEVEILPIGDDGRERIWGLSPEKIVDGTEQFEIRQDPNRKLSIWRKIRPHSGGSLPSTWWESNNYSIVEHGASELEKILGRSDRPFPFPKSPYSVIDALRVAGAHRPDSVVVDFFAGSGTTLNAVEMLNAFDGGNRRCILVTNNEVSADEASDLTKQALRPGDEPWEQHGVCRSVTWPRSKYTILGRRDDGTELAGEYLTGRTVTKEKPRTYRQLSFIDPAALTTTARKRELVSLIGAIPAGEIKGDTAWFVSPEARCTAAILFDATQGDAFLEALEGTDHITHFYIVTQNNRRFVELKAQIEDLLGPIEALEEEKRPMRDGFPANLEYFRLDFLDKDHVALGRQFREILPLLWLRAGAVGARPELPADAPIPAMLIPAANPFAVLVDETRFADFMAAVSDRRDLTHLFLITDSEDAFREMAAQLAAPHVIQLYRDYLENFMINRGETA